MSDKNPCPFCGDYPEYLRFLDLCAERANEIWRENEVKTMIDVYKSMDFVQVVRCRDCWHYNAGSCYADQWSTASLMPPHKVTPYGFCAWGERKWLTCKCGEELESEGKCPSCGRWVHDDQA